MVLIRFMLAVVIIIFLTIPSYMYVYRILFQNFTSEARNGKLFYNVRKCESPFVKIGNSCYFFSDLNKHIDYYKIKYNGRFYSVPKKLDWLHTQLGCETLDPQAHPISLENLDEMQSIGKYMIAQGFHNLYTFWSSGHRAKMLQIVFDPNTMDNFFWHTSTQPMNFTRWIGKQTIEAYFPDDFCVNLQLIDEEIFMSTMSCHSKLTYVCEREL